MEISLDIQIITASGCMICLYYVLQNWYKAKNDMLGSGYPTYPDIFTPTLFFPNFDVWRIYEQETKKKWSTKERKQKWLCMLDHFFILPKRKKEKRN